MPKVWSFNTTVRNPERIFNFLKVLSEFAGKIFDDQTQSDFFRRCVQKRLYKPTGRTLKEPHLIAAVNEDSGDDISDEILNEIIAIFDSKEVDSAGRGRTTAGIINRFGLSIAAISSGPVIITELGKEWLNGDLSDEKLFFRLLLKWQYPNPIEDGYDDFDIKPFFGTLHVINKLNYKWKMAGNNPIGLSKDEYALFIPSLKKYSEIDSTVDEIIVFRNRLKVLTGKTRTRFFINFINKRVTTIFKSSDTLTKWNDLKDYYDSSVRYFRLSNLIYRRGSNNYVDLNPNKKIEIAKLLSEDNASSEDFKSKDEYVDLLNNINLPILPWENEEDLAKINDNLVKSINSISTDLSLNKEYSTKILYIKRGVSNAYDENKCLESLIEHLRLLKLKEYRYEPSRLHEVIGGLESVQSRNHTCITTRPSLDLEWFTSLSLLILNDAIDILPSYTLGDDGLPLGFTSGRSDIECYYKTFNVIFEVTLQRSRDQWYTESQPVMQHLRDFEQKTNFEKDTYCIFIAPSIHRGTLNTFWNAIKYEYESRPQKIVPLTIMQYIKILSAVKAQFNLGNNLSSQKYKLLFDSFFINIQSNNSSNEWINSFEEVIKNWINHLV